MAERLDESQLARIEQLEAACVTVDGGRLKLEYPTLRTRPGERPDDFLWLSGGDVVGFFGIYQFRQDQAELCGMVHPDHRRAGIGSRLFEAAMAEVRRRGGPTALLIVNRGVDAGEAFALAEGGSVVSSEHRMVLEGDPPPDTPGQPEVGLRPGAADDAGFVRTCLSDAFGLPPEAFEGEDPSRASEMMVITASRERIGVIRVARQGRHAGIYGFAITPLLQGRGYGQAALCSVCRSLRSSGFDKIELEVSVVNPSALHVYERCGFEVVGTEDYYLVG